MPFISFFGAKWVEVFKHWNIYLKLQKLDFTRGSDVGKIRRGRNFQCVVCSCFDFKDFQSVLRGILVGFKELENNDILTGICS